MIWNILGIEKTKDENIIKNAYRKKLRFVNPEDDEEGFKELRGAYDQAMIYAGMPDGEEEKTLYGDYSSFSGKKNEVDLWIEKINRIYVDVAKRRNVSLWEEVLKDPVCDDLDTELEAADKLLVYFMNHSYMPQKVWQVVNLRFGYEDNIDNLKERFPQNYLDYIVWQIHHPGFIDFDLFDGNTASNVDEFIGLLYDVRSAMEEEDVEQAKGIIRKLLHYDLTHPYVLIEKARTLLLDENVKEALEIMQNLDFEYSDNPYVERIYGEALLANGDINQAKEVFTELLDKYPENTGAMLGIAKCLYQQKDYENAKSMVEDVLENRVQDPVCMQLLDDINNCLISRYEDEWQLSHERDIGFKLGWCYYQKRDFDKAISLLDEVEEDLEEYDYVNLRCRLYLANEMYEHAYPLTRIWLKLIENSVDDGSKEIQKRKNRLSLAYFSVGICEFEKALNNDNKSDSVTLTNQAEVTEAETYIKKSIDEEKNVLVRLSYMEQLAKYYTLQKRYMESIDLCNEMISTDKGFYPAYILRQRANYEMRNAREVVDDYFACKEMYPAYSVPYVLAAEVFYAFEQYDDVEQVIQAGADAGIESLGLEFYSIKCLHYKAFSKENCRKALDCLDKLIQKVESLPEDVNCDIENISDLYHELVILLWDLDLSDKALDALDESIKKVEDEDSKELRYLKVDILIREKRIKEAETECERLIEVDPQNVNYQLKMAHLYERMNAFEKAIERYRYILLLKDDFVPAIRRLMYIYSNLSNERRDLELCKVAIEYATQYIKLTNDADGYVERGNLYIDLYELEKSVADCRAAIELDEKSYYAYNNLGCALLKLRRVEEAIEPLEKVISLEPDQDYLPYLNLAECYRLQKEYDKAITAMRKVIHLKKSEGKNYTKDEKEIVKLYCLKKDYTKACYYYENKISDLLNKQKLIRVDERGKIQFREKMTVENKQELMSYYCELADIYRQMNETRKTVELYWRAEKLYTKYGTCEYHYLMDRMATFLRDYGKVQNGYNVVCRVLNKEKEENTTRQKTIYLMASLLYEMKSYKEAAEYARIYLNYIDEKYGGEEGISKDARYMPAKRYMLSLMYLYAGRIEEAKKCVSKMKGCLLCIVCEHSECCEYYYCMGRIAMAENKKEDAISYYKKALQINPDYPECAYQLKQIKNDDER